MGTTPAAFRLERDVLSKGKIDLLFEEAAAPTQQTVMSEKSAVRPGDSTHFSFPQTHSDLSWTPCHMATSELLAPGSWLLAEAQL